MARTGRKVDGGKLEQIIESSDLSMTDVGRKFAQARLKRKPNEKEARNGRSQIQKLIREDAPVQPRTVRLIAEVLKVDPEAFLLPEETGASDDPAEMMRVALANQHLIRADLRSLTAEFAALTVQVQAALVILESTSVSGASARKQP